MAHTNHKRTTDVIDDLVNGQYGTSAMETNLSHECRMCKWFRPARETESFSGDVVTLWAYCAQNRRLCNVCDLYEVV